MHVTVEPRSHLMNAEYNVPAYVRLAATQYFHAFLHLQELPALTQTTMQLQWKTNNQLHNASLTYPVCCFLKYTKWFSHTKPNAVSQSVTIISYYHLRLQEIPNLMPTLLHTPSYVDQNGYFRFSLLKLTRREAMLAAGPNPLSCKPYSEH